MNTLPDPQRIAILREAIPCMTSGATIEECLDAIEQLVRERDTLKTKLEAAREDKAKRPTIVCLCGSTRFIERFAILTWEMERQGNIVLGCTLLPAWYCDVPSHFGEATGTKDQCDWLHKRKIDLADIVFIINIGGYIGDSTRSEIEYAASLGKPIQYLEPITAARTPSPNS